MPQITVNGVIPLPADMYWINEFSWSPITVKEVISITGVPIIQVGKKTTGRRITLQSGDDVAWLTRSVLDDLKDLQKSQPTPTFTLLFADGRSYNVMFDDTSSDAISANAKQPGKFPASSDYFTAILRFMEV